MINELFILAILVAGGYFIGNDLGASSAGVIGGLIVFISWQLLQLRILKQYLLGQSEALTITSPLWQQIYTQVRRLQQNGQKRPKELQTLLRFQESVSALPLGIVFLDKYNQVEWLNQAASQLLGLRDPQDVGRNISHLLRQPDIVDSLKKGDDVHEVSLQTKKHHLNLYITYFSSRHLIIVQDMTRLRHLQALHHELLSDVSHELRSPLTVVQGYAEILSNNQVHDVNKISTEILKHAQEMKSIIDNLLSCDLLETRALRSDQCTTVSIEDLIQEVISNTPKVFPEKPCLIKPQIESTAKIYGSHHELKQALTNLVCNAVHYSDNDGVVNIVWQSDNEGGKLSVIDHGRGIAAEHIPLLTERFYRVDKDRSRHSGGIGLGLAIVKGILQRHQARLQIESELGKGSVFCCRFDSSVLRSD